MDVTRTPIVVMFGYKDDDKAVFIGSGKRIEISGANEIIFELLSRCNGYLTVSEVIEPFSESFNKRSLIELLETLFENEILLSSKEIYKSFHGISSNPMPFWHPLTEIAVTEFLKHPETKNYNTKRITLDLSVKSKLMQLLEKRESIRDFSGEPILFNKLSLLFQSGYGVVKRKLVLQDGTSVSVRTVPSGGALYPLHLYCLLLKSNEVLGKGIYHFNAQSLCFELVKKGNFASKLKGVFRDYDEIINRSAAIIVVSGKFSRTAEKYSNRGYRYILLEAGHVAQNIYLLATEQNLGVCEIGGFEDSKLAEVIGIKFPDESPLIAFFAGIRSSK